MAEFSPQQIRSSRITFKTEKKFAWVQLLTRDAQQAHQKEESKETCTLVCYLPQNIATESDLSLHLSYRHTWSLRTRTITVPFRDMLLPVAEGKQEWRQSYGRSCELIVEFAEGQYTTEMNVHSQDDSGVQELRPTTDVILGKCPHFRILVIGRTGAGKSSLINKIFGVGPSDQKAHVSHGRPGEADINIEIRSKSNPQFILHDSLGFEPGETEHFDKVRNFIQERNEETDIKKKLHAVWVCTKIPIMGERVLETGTEHLLQLKMEGKLGDVPIIVVFTQYDRFCNYVDMQLHEEDPSSELTIEDIKARAQEKLIKEIIEPFEENVGHKVVHATVSTTSKPGYEYTLQDLARTTFDTVYNYLSGASLATAMAQRVNPEVKILAIIDVGKKQYWRGLASSLKFQSYTLDSCLGVIHTDIIKVWDFNDSNQLLLSREFRDLVTSGVDIKIEGQDSTETLSVGFSMLAVLGGILLTLSGPVAPIALPIAAAFVWARELYDTSQATVRRMMTYIFDLTMVTQNLFWILQSGPYPLTCRLIKLAYRAHISSNQRNKVLVDIDKYSREGPVGADTTFEKIRELIESSMINSAEMLADKKALDLDGVWAQGEEDWHTPHLPPKGEPSPA